jgi:phage terminase small subunit
MNTLPALSTYQIDADAKLGPAMAALTDKQRQFVLALIQTGCSQSKAAELAGYAGGPDTWKAMGWRLAHDARVQAAIHEEAQKLIRTTAVMAIGVIEGLASNTKVKPEVRLKAATELLNRSGLHAQTEHKVTVDRQMDDRELVRRIASLAREQGLDPFKLLGSRGYIIDAEYELISGPNDQPLAPSAAGLEDLLE